MIVRTTTTNFLPMPADHAAGRSTDRVHVSTLIRIIGKALGQYNEFEKQVDAAGNDITPNLGMCLGLAWEDWYAKVSKLQLAYHPGEIELDDIVGSPDAIGITEDGQSSVLHEFKLTWLSIKPIETVWKYIAQTKSYCKMLGTNFAVLHVFYIHGGYTRGVPPGELAVIYSYHIEFTDDELDINWRHILAAAEQLKQDQAKADEEAALVKAAEAVDAGDIIQQILKRAKEDIPPWESSTPADAAPTVTQLAAASTPPPNPSAPTSGGKVLNFPKR